MLKAGLLQQASTYTERQQLYVLLGEVCETAQYTAADAPLPYVASVLAARILLVLTDPLHFMYVKASEFLHRGPRWDVAKLPSYWVNKVVQQEPTLDEEYYSELEWLLQCLTDGLRTPTVSKSARLKSSLTLTKNTGHEHISTKQYTRTYSLDILVVCIAVEFCRKYRKPAHQVYVR